MSWRRGLWVVGLVGMQGRGGDDVRIVSVAPDGPLVRGVPVAVTVVVEATLASSDSGLVRIGFNDDDPARFRMVDGKTIHRGAQRVELKEGIVPVDWGRAGAFAVMVNIGGPSVGKSWQPTGSARRTLMIRP